MSFLNNTAQAAFEAEALEQVYIPDRFKRMINAHLLGNLIDITDYPVIMWVVGSPGNGKTWQLRRHLGSLGFNTHSVNAANLESDTAGDPAKYLQRCYLEASSDLAKDNPSVLLIDDIDTTTGEWENNTGTVNHQNSLAFLMHIADSPTYIEQIGSVRRVPIFLTGNYLERLYTPLQRPGRTAVFKWEPEYNEKISIVQRILHTDNDKTIAIIKQFPDKPISFFSQLVVTKIIEILSNQMHALSFEDLLKNNNGEKNRLINAVMAYRANTEWLLSLKDADSTNG